MKLVLVKWIDAVTKDIGWRKIEDIKKQKPDKCETVGWIIKQTKSHVTIVSTIGGDECDGDITIPLGMIKEIIPLEAKKVPGR